MLIVSIAHLVSLSIVILIFAMIILITLHVWIHCCISFDFTCRFSGLYIILIFFEHDVCITIHLDHHSLYVYMSDIFVLCLTVCCMTTLLLRDCMSLVVWVTHLSPYLQPSSFGHFLHSDSQFCKCEALCVLIL